MISSPPSLPVYLAYQAYLHTDQQTAPSVYKWYPKLVRGRFVHDTYGTLEATRSRHGRVHMFITHRPTVTLQLHNFDLFRTCRTSSFCTVAWQLARFQQTRRIARSLCDSWPSLLQILPTQPSFSFSWLTTWIPRTVYYYFWAYPFLLFSSSVSHFLVAVVGSVQ